LRKVAAAQRLFHYEPTSKGREIAKFPVDFPVTRELPMETGSYLTAHTTINIDGLTLSPNRHGNDVPSRLRLFSQGRRFPTLLDGRVVVQATRASAKPPSRTLNTALPIRDRFGS
jgi:hypothetical protein